MLSDKVFSIGKELFMLINKKNVRSIINKYFPEQTEYIHLKYKAKTQCFSAYVLTSTIFYPSGDYRYKYFIGAVFHEMAHIILKHIGIYPDSPLNEKQVAKEYAKYEEEAEKFAIQQAINKNRLDVAQERLECFDLWRDKEVSRKNKINAIDPMFKDTKWKNVPDFYAIASKRSEKWIKVHLKLVKQLRKTTKMSQKSQKRQKISGV